MNKLKSVQRRLTESFRQILHTERLARFYAKTLESRRLKLDLTITFCIIRCFVNIDCDQLCIIIDCETPRTRGHSFKLFKKHSDINYRLNCLILMLGIVCQPIVESDSTCCYVQT